MRRTEHSDRRGRREPTAFIKPEEIADTRLVRAHERALQERFPHQNDVIHAIRSHLQSQGRVECTFHNLCISRNKDNAGAPFIFWERFMQSSAYVVSAHIEQQAQSLQLPCLFFVYNADNSHDAELARAYAEHMKKQGAQSKLSIWEGAAVDCLVVPLAYKNGERNGTLVDANILSFLASFTLTTDTHSVLTQEVSTQQVQTEEMVGARTEVTPTPESHPEISTDFVAHPEEFVVFFERIHEMLHQELGEDCSVSEFKVTSHLDDKLALTTCSFTYTIGGELHTKQVVVVPRTQTCKNFSDFVREAVTASLGSPIELQREEVFQYFTRGDIVVIAAGPQFQATGAIRNILLRNCT